MNIVLKTVTLSLFITCLFFQNGRAEKQLVMGVECVNYFPLFTVKNGKYMGFSREFFDSFGRHAGYRFTYRPLRVSRLYRSLLKGEIDFKFPDSPNWKEEVKKGKVFHYSQGIMKYTDGVIVLPVNKGKGLKSIETLGTVLGFNPWVFQGSFDSGAVRLVEEPGFLGLIKKVIKKRVSGAYVNITVANHILENVLHQPKHLVFDPSLPHSKSEYTLSTMRKPDVIKALNAYLESHSMEIQRLKQKYRVEPD